MEEEIWRDIPGYEGLYQVSNFGNVKRIFKKHERLLKPYDVKGYLYVYLCTDNTRKFKTIHSLVLESFIGPRPYNMDVCHCDGNKQNNHLDNLRYDTHRNNIIDCVKQNRQRSQKLSVDDIIEIRRLLQEGNLTVKQIADKFNVSYNHVYNIKNRHCFKFI